jgi:flagellar M-ring protein FliF
LVGVNKLRAEVNADMDFTVQEITQENFNPDTIAIRSEQLSQGGSQKVDVSGLGVPGSLSNEAPADPVMKENQNQTSLKTQSDVNITGSSGDLNRTRNYEIDRTIQHTKLAAGELKRLSISVVIDEPFTINDQGEQERQPITEEKIQRFENLVKTAVGFDTLRGDNVTVLGMAFQVEEQVPAAPMWEQVWLQNLVGKILLSLLALVFILLVLRPAIKNLVGNKALGEPGVSNAVVASSGPGKGSNTLQKTQQNEEESIESSNTKLQNSAQFSVSPEMLDLANSYDDKAALMRTLVKEDSKRVAGVILNWVKSEA